MFYGSVTDVRRVHASCFSEELWDVRTAVLYRQVTQIFVQIQYGGDNDFSTRTEEVPPASPRGSMRFLVRVPDRLMDELMKRCSISYGMDDASSADVIQHLIVNHPASVDEEIGYADVDVEEQ